MSDAHHEQVKEAPKSECSLTFEQINGVIFKRSSATFLAISLLLILSTIFIRISLATQKQTLEVSAITYEQRALLNKLSEHILFLLKSANEQTPDRMIFEVQKDLEKQIETLNFNHKRLSDLHQHNLKQMSYWPYASASGHKQVDILGKITQSFDALNERVNIITQADIDIIRTGFNFWRPQDLAIVRDGEYTLQLSALNEQVYDAALQQNQRLSSLHNYLFLGMFIGIWLIWLFILRPMIQRLKQQFFQLQSHRDQLQYQAAHDALTGLYNRKHFNDQLQLQSGLAYMENVGVIALDIDGFKAINDSHGHAAGDFLLQEVARRLRVTLLPHEIQYRMGGDEFTLVFSSVLNEQALMNRARELVEQFSSPIVLGERSIKLMLSIGVAYQQEAVNTIPELCSAADIALYHVKNQGGNSFALYRNISKQHISQVLQLEQELLVAIKHNEFQVFYQPLVSLADEKIVGFEALVRWQHPRHGLLFPNDWLETAERISLMSDISMQVVEQVVADLSRLAQMGKIPVPVSINTTKNLLISGGLLQNIMTARQNLPVGSESLINIEVPESIVLDQNFQAILGQMKKIQQMGVNIALDDFGTGFATLSHLLTLPFDTLKIDKQFILGLPGSENRQLIVSAMITLAQGMGKRLVCEGVEDEASRDLLLEMGCHYVQGHYYYPALPFREIVPLLEIMSEP